MTPKEFVDFELRIVENVFNKAQVLHPMVVFVKDNLRSIITAEFRNDAHKDVLSQGIKELVKKADPDIVIYSCEAWAVNVKDPNEDTQPAYHPNRSEVAVVRIEFKTGEKYDCQAKILRQKGQARLDKFEVLPGGLSMGRFVDFFPITKMN